MKVYIVKAPQGEYEDYCEPIIKVFADKGKAEEYVKIENAKLPLEQADKCEECLWKWKMAFEHNDEKPKCFNPDKYKTCQNYFKYSGISPLFMEEYEVEEYKEIADNTIEMYAEKCKVLEKALKLSREYMFNVMCADDVPSVEWFIKCAKEMIKSE